MTSKESKKYKKLSQLEHLLLRPHMYIGEIYDVEQEVYIYNEKDNCMNLKKVKYTPGIGKLFDEIILNACDHAIDTNQVTKIKVTVDPKEGSISVYNNGPGIPILKHEDEGVYIPELIFTHFLTSSNYDDNQTRLKSGLNGLGAKITSSFSTKFTVETVRDGVCYKQSYMNNLKKIKEPKINKVKKDDYTKITFHPDLEKFKVDSLSQGTYKILERRVYDIAAYTDPKIKVYFNGKVLGINSFKDYVKLFLNDDQRKECVVEETERWKVALCSSRDEEFQGISFVNGVHTLHGGTHTNYVVNQALKQIATKLNSTLRNKVLKEQLMLICFAKIENPEFKSQAKEELTTKSSQFGSQFRFTQSSLSKIVKMSCITRIKNYMQFKLSQKFEQGDSKRKKKLTGIPNLDDANKAGTNQSDKCMLFLTEGLSAKTFAVSGLSVIGREYNGVFPLKGKLLNVRSSNMNQIIKNTEIQNIKKILGLSTKYETIDEIKENLRYHKVCLLCDADIDGQHIQGLLINFFHHFWPELVRCNFFITAMRTPIIKAISKKETYEFFDDTAYQKFKKDHRDMSSYKIKYYKGLGSSTSKEAKELFKKMEQCHVQYLCHNDNDEDAISLAFAKDRVQDRKAWIKHNTGKELELKVNKNKVMLNNFFNSSFVKFSISDCIRSIPNLMDGLKPTQRKILYGFLKKNTLNELKVDQIRGYIAEQTLYAHGETSLNETIISMNHDFVGSNNINLFIPCGAFGSRIMGGKDAASPRYIATKLNPITQELFNCQDNDLLTYLKEGSISIEPEYYVPILPMILVNGSSGIGTGYSTDIPCYNPEELKECLKLLIKNPEAKLPKLMPWYKNFKGKIGQEGTTYYSEGLIQKSKKNELEITELPIGVWTDKYKDYLDLLIQNNKIKSFKNYSTESTVRFLISIHSADSGKSMEAWIKLMKLRAPIKYNLTCFDENNSLKIFKDPRDIIRQFFKVRMVFYKKRYDHLKKIKRERLELISTKVKFIQMVIANKIKVFRHSRKQVLEQLIKNDFKEKYFESLLDIRIHQFTTDKVKEYEQELDKESSSLKILEKTKYYQLWEQDLDTL